MQAITTKYHGPGNSRGARISATSASGQRIYISYPYDLSDIHVHAKAALALCAKLGWEGDLFGGGSQDGYVFVFASSERIANPTVDARRLAVS